MLVLTVVVYLIVVGGSFVLWDIPAGHPINLQVVSIVTVVAAGIGFRLICARAHTRLCQWSGVAILAVIGILVMNHWLGVPMLLLCLCGPFNLMKGSAIKDPTGICYLNVLAVIWLTMILAGPACPGSVTWGLGIGLLATLLPGVPNVGDYLQRDIQ